MLGQEKLNGALPGGGSAWCIQQSTETDACYQKNIHPDGCSRVPDRPEQRTPIQKSFGNFEGGIQAKHSIKPAYSRPTSNNAHSIQVAQLHNEAFLYKPEKTGITEAYEREKKFARSRRKRYGSGISANDLKLFTKAVGFQSCTDESPNYICELLDYVVDSKQVYSATKCPRGSKFLQHQIINANDVDRNDILKQVIEKLVPICNDNYGNYVVQCLFMLKNPVIEREILMRMRGSLCVVAMNQYGCRVLQKAIPTINDELLRIVIDAIAPNTFMLAVHNFGYHVLQRAIERGVGKVVRVLLLNAMGTTGRRRNRLVELSKNSFGCRIVQGMLEKAYPEDRETIIRAVMSSNRDLRDLCVDEYGNYVVQHIVKQFQEQYSMAVMDVLNGRLLKMAKNKFCSNVLEVLYKRGGRKVEDRLIQQVDHKFVKECLSDRFANYLVQTMLTEGVRENRAKIRHLLETIPNLIKLKFGKFVNHRLCKMNRSLAKEGRGHFSLEE